MQQPSRLIWQRMCSNWRLPMRRGVFCLEVAARRGHNKAAVAVANKLARRLWAMTRDGAAFDGDHISTAPAMR
jgi:hypothetical protein